MANPTAPMLAVCPTQGEIEAFLRDVLGEASSAAMASHLSSCPQCESAIARLDAASDEPWRQCWSDLAASDTDPHHDDTYYEEMVQEAGKVFPPEREVPPPERIGNYQLGISIGRGGMGVVYKALHVPLQKWVALKILAAKRLADPRAVARFEREMAVVGKLDHPNIVRATDAGFLENHHYLAMELIDGVDLGQLARRLGPLPLAEAAGLIRQAALGLQHAHENGLVHRDIKPHNLMLSRKGELKVLDLGLALLREDQGAKTLSGVGQVMGTADYMAPEQWESSHEVDIRADIYSLGCTFYYLLSGRAPFQEPKYNRMLRKMEAHLHAAPPPISMLRPEVPAGLAAVLESMLAKRPEDRPATPAALAAALAPFCRTADLASLLILTGTYTGPTLDVPSPRAMQSSVNELSDGQVSTRTHTVPTRPRVSRSRVHRGWLLVVAALAAAGLTWLAVKPGRPDLPTDDQKQPPVEPVATREFRPGEWHDLLQDPPTEFHWFNPELRSRHWHDAKTKRMGVNSHRLSLLSLGRVDAPGFTLRVTFRQTPWTGGIGVFYGGLVDAADANRVNFGWIELRPEHAGVNPPMMLHRARGSVVMLEKQNPLAIEKGLTSPWKLARALGHQDATLELDVNRRGLESVSWNGEPCPSLGDSMLARGDVQNYLGEFGVFSRDASVTVLSAQYLPTP